MHQFRFRALVTMDQATPREGALRPPARQYPAHTRSLSILARPLRAGAGPARYLPAEIWRDDEAPLRPGERILVTARVSDDQAGAYLDAGQPFTLWLGGEVGHGVICRRVFSDYSPS